MDTKELIAKDKQHIWHPFTDVAGWLAGEPLIIAEGHGAKLIDTEGREYIDGVSSLWTNVHGHRVPEIDQAVRDQLDRIAHSTLLGLGNVPSIEFAAKLAPYLPGDLSRIFYSDSGATSVEVALKLAFTHHYIRGKKEKTAFLRFDGAYHGDTIGSVSVGGIDSFHALFRPLLFDSPVAPYPFCRDFIGRRAFDTTADYSELYEQIAKLVEQNADKLIGIIIEPLMQGASGMRPSPRRFLSFLSKLCGDYDLLLIVDEVATGFGRTGTMFACEQEQVVPDLMAMAKGISGGYLPLAATAVSEEIFESFLNAGNELRTFFHGHTYTGNPLACAAAIASLDLFESRNVIASLPEKIAAIEEGLMDILSHPHAGHARNVGLMTGIELVKDKTTDTPFDPSLKIGAAVCTEARKYGVMLRPLGDVIVLMPPLCIEVEEIRTIFSALKQALNNVEI